MKGSIRILVAVALLSLPLLFVDVHGKVTDSAVNADLQAYIASRTAPYASVTSFSFGVFSDIHMIESTAGGLSRLQWQHLLTRWRDLGNLFGLIVGDLGYGAAADITNVLSGPAAVPTAPPVFYQMGNHELDGVGKRAWIDALYPGAVRSDSWTVNASYSPGNGDHAYYSFNVGPSTHFIVLDGDYMASEGVQIRQRQSFGQAQLAWLAADIAANSTRNILVFVHEPIDQQLNGSTPYYMLTDRGSVLDLLAAHPKQKFVFSGHYHSFSGVTQWRGVTSVHVMQGSDPNYGVQVTVNGESITVANAGVTTNFDAHPMNAIETAGSDRVIKVAEDGGPAGFTRGQQMSVVAAENGVIPTSGSLMLKATDLTWYQPRFISEQLIKILPGMQLSYDIYLQNVVSGKDAVTVQPDWYKKDGALPPLILDQNGLQLSRRIKDGSFFIYNEDVPLLGGRATDRWYHRQFDLTPMAGNYVDGLYLTTYGPQVNVATAYVDNIRFVVPNTAPTVSLTSPSDLALVSASAVVPITATASDADGIAKVDFYAGATLIGTRTAPPYAISWSGMAVGTYTLTAVATDAIGTSTTSSGVRVTATGNVAPTIAITSPNAFSTFATPATISVSANASDPDGTIARVDFYGNGSLIGSRTVAPYTISWSGMAAGTYAVSAVATDNAGASTVASSVTVFVTAAARTNVALAANGGTATASSTQGSGYPASAVINGDRRGLGWGTGGAWMDATAGSWPDWVEVDFSGAQTIDEVDVFSLQDNYLTPADPTASLTFNNFGLRDFEVQYWTGSAWLPVPGGTIAGNTLVWRKLTFAALTTAKIRVWVTSALWNSSRVVEVEAYAASAPASPPANVPPTSTLTAPATGATFLAPATIVLSASASDTDGSVTGVTFYANGSVIGTASASPYTVSWAGVGAGTYALTAVAVDNAGATTTSSPVNVTVTAAPAPRVNVALASNGGSATASSTQGSGYPVSSVINGDRRGLGWAAGGAWMDATPNTWPDWVEVSFSGAQSINEVDVFSVQDSYVAPIEPTASQTFTYFGLRDFEVQYWTGSAWLDVPGGAITGNNLVWRNISFPTVTTTKIRVWVTNALWNSTRIVEIEAYTGGSAPEPVALEASSRQPSGNSADNLRPDGIGEPQWHALPALDRQTEPGVLGALVGQRASAREPVLPMQRDGLGAPLFFELERTFTGSRPAEVEDG